MTIPHSKSKMGLYKQLREWARKEIVYQPSFIYVFVMTTTCEPSRIALGIKRHFHHLSSSVKDLEKDLVFCRIRCSRPSLKVSTQLQQCALLLNSKTPAGNTNNEWREDIGTFGGAPWSYRCKLPAYVHGII